MRKSLRKSLIGHKFGKLSVIEYEGSKGERNSYWKCKCDCGKEVVVKRSKLKSKISKNISCGCTFVYDITGSKNDKITVEGLAYKKNGTTYWNCKCKCGKNFIVRRSHIKEVKSCGCNKKGKLSGLWRGCGDISGSFFQKIVHRCKRSKCGIKLKVDIKYLWDLFVKQEGKCALSGMKLILPKNNYDLHYGISTASVDRIDSSKDYIRGNVQWVHKDINLMKHRFEESYFLTLCKKITDNRAVT